MSKEAEEKMRSIYCGLLALCGISWAGDGSAQVVTAVQPIPGYTCMSLALDPEQMRSFAFLPPVKRAPSDTADNIGVAGSVVVARASLRQTNGYVEILMPNRRQGYVKASYLRPYHSASNPNAKCVPSVMSNNTIGFTD